MFQEMIGQWTQHSVLLLWRDNVEYITEFEGKTQFFWLIFCWNPVLRGLNIKKYFLKGNYLNFFHFYSDLEKETSKSFFQGLLHLERKTKTYKI